MNLEYDFDEIKEYSLIYERNPTVIIPFFIGSVIVFIIVFLVMIFTVDKEYVVTTQGNIQSEDAIDISFPAPGKISKVNFKEGDTIKKDDVIFELDDSYYKSQIEKLNSDHDIDVTNERLYLKQKDCVIQGINDFDVNDKDEATFYYKMQVYLQSLYDLNNNSRIYNQKSVLKNNALSEASIELDAANNDLKNINAEIGNNSSNSELIGNLTLQRDLKQRQIDLLNLRIKSINETTNLFDVNKDDEKSNYYKIEAYFNNLNEIDSGSSSSVEAQREMLKNDALIDINENLKNISDKKEDYEIKLSSLQNEANNLKVKSPQNGYVHYLIPVAEGMTVDTLKPYVKLNGVATNDINMITMIPAPYIKNIDKGYTVKVSFDLQGGYSKKYINGSIISIDSDITTDGILGQSYYKAFLRLDENIENPKTNMPAEVKIVYDKRKWVDYIMELLSFKAKTVK